MSTVLIAVRSRRASALLLALIAVAAVLVQTGRAYAYPPTPPDAAASRTALAALVVSTPGSMTGYSRDKFPHWINQPTYGSGCDTREVVLKRDGTGVAAGSDCYPDAGSWYSVYDGTTTTDPSKVQISGRVIPYSSRVIRCLCHVIG